LSPLLAVPNVSEGRDAAVIAQIARAATEPAGVRAGHIRLLGIHSDVDHNRTVLTLLGGAGELAASLVSLAAAAIRLIDVNAHEGIHPRIGVIDVAPIVFTTTADRGGACAEALVLADRLADELGLPVFLYGLLSERGRTRAEIRRGGPQLLAQRIAAGELTPDFGPAALHPSAGAVLVGARPPLVAFNVELAAPATVEDARRIAALIRESGRQGLPGVRALGLHLAARGVAQISANIEDPAATSPAALIEAIRRHAVPARAELVGLAPAAALADLPGDVPLANRCTIEDMIDGAISDSATKLQDRDGTG
jgi:glutamate formiminotransferase/glutamate formiminotransferase/formiminotetrahydrofolate cyclodeaminase